MLKHLLALLLACTVMPVVAIEIRVPVESPQTIVLDEMLTSVAEGVAERLTGESAEALTERAPDLFNGIESLVSSYGYNDGFFIVNLDVDTLKARLASSEISLWQGARPEFLLWATEEQGLERNMIGLEPHPVMAAIEADAARFGVSIRRPLMDLEDTLALSPPEVWGGFTAVVERASDRYGAEHVVVVGDRPDRNRLRYWLYQPGQPVQTAEVEGESPEARARTFIERLVAHAKTLTTVSDRPVMADRIESSEWVGSADGRVIQIRYSDPIRLMALMDHLEGAPEGLSVLRLSVSDGVAEVQVKTQLSLEATDRLISEFGPVQFVAPMQYSLN